MGTWGTGYFEDDSALDYMAVVEASNNPKQKIKAALDAVLDADYVDSDDATAAIVAATYIDSQLNGTKFGSTDTEDPLEVDTFSIRNPSISFADLKTDAVVALKKVIADNSELHELWMENDEDYPEWKAGVEKLILSLSK